VAKAHGFPTVVMIGGGQLSRMTQQAAIALGVELRVLSQSPTESAAQVVGEIFIGQHDDAAAIEKIAIGADVVTFDHEHVPLEIIRDLESRGVVVRPGSKALAHAQDKVLMRQKLESLEIKQPKWKVLNSISDGVEFANVVSYPFIIKVSRGGYDGRGVWVCKDETELADLLSQPLGSDVQWLAEEFIPFERELSAQVARSPHPQMIAYPVVETQQKEGMCSVVIAPAPNLDPERAVEAQRVAMQIADALDVTGMLAVELFDTGSEILVNELAMRPHNSGHWSIDGAITSQFENHLRAVLDLPLGSPKAKSEWTVMVNVIGGDFSDMFHAFKHCMARDPHVKIHMYGKEVRKGRKIGHVNVSSEDLEDALRRAQHAADYLIGNIEE
jgi:5-(carboxyamino)imidazole ribonucleotide synthase